MNDTPRSVLQKQFNIISSIPLRERFRNVFELTELSRRIIENRIKEQKPEITGLELKIELFKSFYQYDFDEETLNIIVKHLEKY